MQHRPLRPYFYKPVAPLGVPLKFWVITIVATVLSGILFFILIREIAGIPTFIFSTFVGIGLAAFFLWSHNQRKRGYLFYAPRFFFLKITGIGNNLIAARVGRTKTKWIKDSDGTFPEWTKD